jgi:uncharacterized protein (DUF1778 family)
MKNQSTTQAPIAFRCKENERRLAELAAHKEAVNVSEFLRRALKERAKRVLFCKKERGQNGD